MLIELNVYIASGEATEEGTDIPLTTEIIEPNANLRFLINYPVTHPNPVEVTHADGSGWTAPEFVDAVRAAYREMYASETNPGHMPNTFNRGKSAGKFGIWGHDIEDLSLAYAERGDDGQWALVVNS